MSPPNREVAGHSSPTSPGPPWGCTLSTTPSVHLAPKARAPGLGVDLGKPLCL